MDSGKRKSSWLGYKTEIDLRWYYAGGLSLEVGAVSNAGSTLECLTSGSASPPPACASLGPPDHVLEAAARERRLRRAVEAATLRDPGAGVILRAAYGQPRAVGSLLAWGPYASVLLIAPSARKGYLDSKTTAPYLDWLVRLRSNTEAASLVAVLSGDIDSLMRRARRAWDGT